MLTLDDSDVWSVPRRSWTSCRRRPPPPEVPPGTRATGPRASVLHGRPAPPRPQGPGGEAPAAARDPEPGRSAFGRGDGAGRHARRPRELCGGSRASLGSSRSGSAEDWWSATATGTCCGRSRAGEDRRPLALRLRAVSPGRPRRRSSAPSTSIEEIGERRHEGLQTFRIDRHPGRWPDWARPRGSRRGRDRTRSDLASLDLVGPPLTLGAQPGLGDHEDGAAQTLGGGGTIRDPVEADQQPSTVSRLDPIVSAAPSSRSTVFSRGPAIRVVRAVLDGDLSEPWTPVTTPTTTVGSSTSVFDVDHGAVSLALGGRAYDRADRLRGPTASTDHLAHVLRRHRTR